MPGRTDWTAALVHRERERYRRARRTRPDRVESIRPGQESVWAYPRPPRVEQETRSVRVVRAGIVLASSREALRVLETASPPTVYVPSADVRTDQLRRMPGRTLCEWKGLAEYWWPAVGEGSAGEPIAWSYPEPFTDYGMLRGYVAFFPGRVDDCRLGDERVRAQPGDYYGGWVTDDVAGPFKGPPGTETW